MSEKYLIEMKNIYKYYGSVEAVHNISLRIGENEIVGLVGDNAAGKSTLMKILSGVVLPDSGEIYVEGKKVKIESAMDSIKCGIEMVHQNLALFDNLDIKGNIFINRESDVGSSLGRKLFKFWLYENEMEKTSKKLLENLGVNIPSVRALTKYLSGGQRQAVAIARVLLFNAKLIIMDEPTSALAVKEVGKILDIISHLKCKEGKSIVLISHRMEDIFRVADRVVVLRRGRNVGERIIKDTNMEEIVHLIIGTGNNIDEAATT
ncbi:MAG: ATP-binding cassette domain-containing protein [Actinobacteria bacterium]|nr:ATP-binding cassette domain-containing protein [Actinomycetota bacterium]